ncbi:MAG: hypothetical protein J7M25_00700 [Deltaproteobacteria bacterium]|nr:hypothetical protein [Deltaproteobacteria bacterium]
MAMAIPAALTVAWLGCHGGDSNRCVSSQNPPSVDGGLQCGLPVNLNETDQAGNVIGPGAFGIKVVEYVHVNAGGIVETNTISVLLMLAYIDHHLDTNDTDIGVQLCKIQIPKVDIPGQSKPTVFQTLPALLPNIPKVWVKGTMTGHDTCDTFTTEKAITPLGACLPDPLSAVLPNDPASQTCSGAFDTSQKDDYCNAKPMCLYDVDIDSYPGATLEAQNVPGLDVDLVFTVMRSWVALDGMAATNDLLLGTATFDLQVVPFACRLTPMGGGAQRDCNNDELKIVMKINPDITQTPGQDSTFVAVRVPSDTTCQDIIDDEMKIFGR